MTTPTLVPRPRAPEPDPSGDLVPRPRPPADDLVESHMAVARSVASRYRNRGIADEDLDQVAYLALVKAARRFDPDVGHDFVVYAVPTIRGELRRHFRDRGWMIRPPRRLQELQLDVRGARSVLAQELGRNATVAEVSDHLGADEVDVREVLAMDGCFTPASLAQPVGEGDSTLADLVADGSGDWSRMEARTVLAPVVRVLSARDRRILSMRYVDDSTQVEIGAELGINQSQVSRLLGRIHADLRAALTDPAG